MRLSRIDLHGFSDLRRAVDFGPGLNVVFGPNESGKSRLVSALLAGLCGRVKKRGRGIDDLEAFRPWSGDAFAVELVIELASGRRLELRQNLDEPSRSQVVDVALGRDVTPELVVDRAPDASRLLGLQRDVVPLTLVVRQREVTATRDGAGALQEMLQRAATRTATDATANRAIERLTTFRSDDIGSERANSKKPLREAVLEEQAARRERDAVLLSQREIASLRQELATLGDALDALRRRRREARASEANKEIARIEESLVRIDAIRVRLDAPPPVVAIARPARVLLNDLLGWGRHARRPAAPDTDALGDARAALASLPPMPTGDRSPDERVVEARRKAEVAAELLERHSRDRVDLPSPEAAAGTSPHAVRALADTVEATAPTAADPRPAVGPRRRATWLALGVSALMLGLVAGGLGLGAGVTAVLLFGLAFMGAGVAGLLAARRAQRAEAAAEAWDRRAAADRALVEARRAQATTSLRALGVVPPDAAAARALAHRLEVDADARRRASQWRTRRDELEADHRRAHDGLRALLADRGSVTWDEYLTACGERAAAAAAATRRSDLEHLVTSAEAALRRWEAESRVFDTRFARLVDALRGAGLDHDEPLAAPVLSRAEAALARSEQAEGELAERELLAAEMARLLGAETREGLAARAESLRAIAAGAPLADQGPRGAAATALELDREVAEREADLSRRAGALEERVRSMPSLSEAEERLDRAGRTLERLRRLDRLVDLALRHLASARDEVHRDIAPRLSEALTQVLPALTDGRWTEARLRVDTLSVEVRRSNEAWRDADRLSCGTHEQIYLGLRVVLAQAIGDPAEPSPLVLDDVLVHADPIRRAALQRWLAEVARDRQVIVTTSSPDVAAWGEAVGARMLSLMEAH